MNSPAPLYPSGKRTDAALEMHLLPSKPAKTIQNRGLSSSSTYNIDGENDGHHQSCFSPEVARSANEVCDLYRQALRDHVFALPINTICTPSFSRCYRRSRTTTAESTEENDDDEDCMSTLSDLDYSFAAASDLDSPSYFSDEDSIVIRRQQMQHDPTSTCCSNATPSAPCGDGIVVQMESFHFVDSIDDYDDMDSSVASSVDTLYSFDLERLHKK